VKKFGLIVVGFLFVAVTYYFAAGSTQITQELKKQINHELITLQENGFGIEEVESKKSSEHFVISLLEPKKITTYLKQKNIQVEDEDIYSLKGMQFAIDIFYLNNAYSSISMELYPKAIPTSTIAALKLEDPKLLSEIEKIINNKTLLIHIDFNKILTGFRGYLKDINETFEDKDKTSMQLLTKNITFEGSLKDEKLKSLTQNIENISLLANKDLNLTLSSLEANYILDANSSYNTHSSYKLKELKVNAKDILTLNISNINGTSITSLKNKLLDSSIKGSIEDIYYKKHQKEYRFKNSIYDMELNKLDIEAFEQLQKVNTKNQTIVNKLSQKILSRGLELNISKLSSSEVFLNKKNMGNFNIKAYASINKSFKIQNNQENMFKLLKALNLKTHIIASSGLFSTLVEDPRVLLVLMLFPPKEKNGQKAYDISYKNGKLTVNGMSI
jgi:hypothetical protein